MKRFDRILLIDDDRADNLFHRIVIDETGITERVDVFEMADTALRHLQSNTEPVDLILLDLNLPRMDGFDFLDAYAQRVIPQRARAIVVLTNSLSPKDINRASAYPDVLACINKPLTPEFLHSLLQMLESA